MIEEKKYRIKLETLEPFRIGGTEDPLSGNDNPVAIVGNKIAIPGPSLKGAYRVNLEKFLIDKYYDKENGKWPENKKEMQPCIPSPEKNLSEDEKNLIAKDLYKKENCHYPCVKRKCGDRPHQICPVCYLLGAMGLNGFVRIPFLFSEISASSLYSTRLDRVKETVIKGTNRPYQIIPTNTIFTGVLSVVIKDDILNWELGKSRHLKEMTKGDAWLPNEEWTQEKIIDDLILNRIQSIHIFGGFKSKGCGKVKITVEKIE